MQAARKRFQDRDPDAIAQIAQLYGGATGHEGGKFVDDLRVKVLDREAFGFQRVTVERPLVVEAGEPVLKKRSAKSERTA